MTVFISGGAKCGKSGIAQEIAVKLVSRALEALTTEVEDQTIFEV